MNQLLTWRLGAWRFGLPLEDCSEVREKARIHHIPHARPYILGVANLRGEVVAVIDLGRFFGSRRPRAGEEGNGQPSACTLIRIKHREQNVAVNVDSLTDVMTVEPEQLEPPPSNFTELQASLTAHVVQTGDEVVLVLRPRALLEPRELAVKLKDA